MPTGSHQHPPLLEAAIGPSALARDTAQREEEEEHADSNLRKVTMLRKKKGLRSSTKMDFMRFRKGSTNEDHGACFRIMIWAQE
jgi:hypothetical protein